MAKAWTSRQRAALVGAALAVVFTTYSGKLIYLSERGRLEASGERPKTRYIRDAEIPLYAHRGAIFARNGEALAAELRVSRVVLDPSLVTDKETTARLIEEHLGMPYAAAMEHLKSRRRYLPLTRQTPREQALALENAMQGARLRGIRLEHDWKRVNPNSTMMAEVLGFTNAEHRGIAGIEQSADKLLRGIDGYRRYKADITGRELFEHRREEVAPRDGYSLRLTLDPGAQAIVDRELDKVMREQNARRACAVIMNPHTGDILAMSSRPSFDLQDWKNVDAVDRQNFAVTGRYEPGSTFKVVAAAAALDQGLVNPLTSIHCHNGTYIYKGVEITDHHGYGDLTVSQVMSKSSNIGTFKLALQLGRERFHGYIEKFGFGQRTGIQLPAENAGLSHSWKRWTDTDFTRVPYGHAITVTPVQMAAAMSVIANGGMYVQPRIIDAIVDEAGKTIEPMPVVERERVIRASTAAQMRNILEKVTQKGGTATRAAVEGYTVAGKTGTANRLRDDDRGYVKDHYVVSFAGFMPADDPAFVALVLVDDPRKSGASVTAGLVAAPLFANIARQLAEHLDIEPDVPGFTSAEGTTGEGKGVSKVVLNRP